MFSVIVVNVIMFVGVWFGVMSWYEWEVIYIWIFKGIGFVIFMIMVVLLFYVMVMILLKS